MPYILRLTLSVTHLYLIRKVHSSNLTCVTVSLTEDSAVFPILRTVQYPENWHDFPSHFNSILNNRKILQEAKYNHGRYIIVT
jgi:hypothetical protein